MIRHAQASFMSDNYDQLSDFGWKQAHMLGKYLAAEEVIFDKIYYGPLRRHRETMEATQAAYQKKGLPWPEPIKINELAEHYGPRAMRVSMPDLLENDPYVKKQAAKKTDEPKMQRRIHMRIFDYFMRQWAVGNIVASDPTIQTWAAFRKQVIIALEKISQDHASGTQVAAFTSGGTISAAVGHIMGMEDEEKIMGMNSIVKNASMSEFLFSKDRMSLVSFNTVPHFQDAEYLTLV